MLVIPHISPASCQQIKLWPNNTKEEQCPFEIIHSQQILGRCINLLYQVISVPLKWDELNN